MDKPSFLSSDMDRAYARSKRLEAVIAGMEDFRASVRKIADFYALQAVCFAYNARYNLTHR